MPGGIGTKKGNYSIYAPANQPTPTNFPLFKNLYYNNPVKGVQNEHTEQKN